MGEIGAMYRAATSATGSCPGCTVEFRVEGPWPPEPGKITELNFYHDPGCPASEDW